MQTKICTKCGVEKPLEDFSKSKTSKLGRRPKCKECERPYHQEYNERTKEYRKKRNKEYAIKNADKIKMRRMEYAKNNREKIKKIKDGYYQRNKKKIEEKRRERKRNNPQVRIAANLRGRLYLLLKEANRSLHTQELIGCSFDYLKSYIESLWLDGMNWDNYGRYGWHMDHIIPCTSFDLTNIEEQKKCFHYTNLQPLWWDDNIRKGNRV